MSRISLGVHVPMHNSLKSQREFEADVVQICLGPPQRWNGTQLPKGDVASPLFVHAPYLVNFSSHNKEVLHKSRENLKLQSKTAAEIDAQGLVIHGGSWKKGDRDKALTQWASSLSSHSHPAKILIENSANGQHSLTRYVGDIEDLWRRVGHLDHVGFCLDTCHLWAARSWKDDIRVVGNILEIVGSIDLIHFNGSATDRGSGTDRHSPLHSSIAPPEWVLEVALATECKTWIAETSDPAADMDIMRRMVKDV